MLRCLDGKNNRQSQDWHNTHAKPKMFRPDCMPELYRLAGCCPQDIFLFGACIVLGLFVKL